nr:uncharacterized protein LOC128698409 [Cherax quadricarinatus]
MEPGKTCSFYVKRKKRYCKMLVRAGQSYCGQHLVEEHVNGETNQLKRIPCPLDPKQVGTRSFLWAHGDLFCSYKNKKHWDKVKCTECMRGCDCTGWLVNTGTHGAAEATRGMRPRRIQHLAICNAREKTGLSYMSRNINLRPGDQEEPPKTSLSSLSDPAALVSFITRVEAAHRDLERPFGMD